MMVLRLLLGIAEAAFTPGMPYYLSFFYLRGELGFRCGLFLSAAPLANCFTGALAYGITSGKSALVPWRLLFLVEGLPVIAMLPVVFLLLPDSAVEAKFLDEEDKLVARARLVRQVGHVTAQERRGRLKSKEILTALLDVKSWLAALMYFACNVSYSPLPVFMPTILKELGFTAIHAQGLTAPPYFLSFVVTLASTWVADRIQQRGYIIMGLSTVSGVGYLIQATCTGTEIRYFGVFLCAAGIFPVIANTLPWVLNNHGSDDQRGVAFVVFSLLGQAGPLVGTRLFPPSEGPRYVKGQSICAAFMFFNVFLAACMRLWLRRKNMQLDRLHSTEMDAREPPAFEAGTENYGSRFRYVL